MFAAPDIRSRHTQVTPARGVADVLLTWRGAGLATFFGKRAGRLLFATIVGFRESLRRGTGVIPGGAIEGPAGYRRI